MLRADSRLNIERAEQKEELASARLTVLRQKDSHNVTDGHLILDHLYLGEAEERDRPVTSSFPTLHSISRDSLDDLFPFEKTCSLPVKHIPAETLQLH